MKDLELLLENINTIEDNNSSIVRGAITDLKRNIRTFSYATERTQKILKTSILKSILYLVIHIKNHGLRKHFFQYVISNMEHDKTSNWYNCNRYYKGISFSYKKEVSFDKDILYINNIPMAEVKDYNEAKRRTKNFLLDISI